MHTSEYVSKLGESIEAFFRRMVAHAHVTNMALVAKHNDLRFTIEPDDNAEDLIDDWWRTYGKRERPASLI